MELPLHESEVVSHVEPAAQNLLLLINQLIKEEQYEGVALLFTSPTESERNVQYMPEIGTELLHDVCLEHLNSDTHAQNPLLYDCAEELLKVIALHGSAEEVLLELLELVEEQKSEVVFTSTLRALQAVLQRLIQQKPHALEWSLSSIHSHLEELPLPEYLTDGYDEKQERLLEQDDQLQGLLIKYISVSLFYAPILKEVVAKYRNTPETFRNCGTTPRNVLSCFLVKLLGKPLALMDITMDGRKTNTYTAQCAMTFAKDATDCMGCDPFYMLALVEQRLRFKHCVKGAKSGEVLAEKNVFLNENKLPLHAFAIYFYMVLVEGVCADKLPKVYSPLYVYESGMYLVTHLLQQREPPLQHRGLLLTQRLLQLLHQTAVPAISLELQVHKEFCNTLCAILSHSPLAHLRRLGLKVLRKYIQQFDEVGKYVIIKNLLRTVVHKGIAGYLGTMYKDMVAAAMLKEDGPLSTCFSGHDFRAIYLQNICHLPSGAETDFVEESDKVICALNALRFFAIKDGENRTGFWNFSRELELQFLHPMRVGLDMSIAHYRAELRHLAEGGGDDVDEKDACEQLNMLQLHIANDKDGSKPLKTDRKSDRMRKISVLKQNLCTLELMRSLLGRTSECLEHPPTNLKATEFSA